MDKNTVGMAEGWGGEKRKREKNGKYKHNLGWEKIPIDSLKIRARELHGKRGFADWFGGFWVTFKDGTYLKTWRHVIFLFLWNKIKIRVKFVHWWHFSWDWSVICTRMYNVHTYISRWYAVIIFHWALSYEPHGGGAWWSISMFCSLDLRGRRPGAGHNIFSSRSSKGMATPIVQAKTAVIGFFGVLYITIS